MECLAEAKEMLAHSKSVAKLRQAQGFIVPLELVSPLNR